MKIRFWGVRGSIPSPGASTVRYGGNTSCVEVRLDDGTLIILDAGSGIRALGSSLGACEATLLLSHYHWDHIQGLPFFGPAYLPGSKVRIIGPEFEGQGPEEYLSAQMMTPFFPAAPSQMHGVQSFEVMTECPFTVGSATIHCARLSHPGVTYGYRIEAGGSIFAYISDNEVDIAGQETLDPIIALAEGADVLVHDMQYSEAEYVTRRNYGHSTPRMAVRVALEAHAHRLVAFHHDPSHNDEQVEALTEEARELAGPVDVVTAVEGEIITLSGKLVEVPRPQRTAPRTRRKLTAL